MSQSAGSTSKLWGPAVGWRNSFRETFEGLETNVVQTTLGGSSEYIIPSLSEDDKTYFTDSTIKKPKVLIIHASHMVNLASRDNRALGILKSTLTKVAEIRKYDKKIRLGVVAHVGRGQGASLERVIQQLLTLKIPEEVTLYMENAAGQGHELASTMNEIEELFVDLPEEIKLCIDTQHSFAAGICRWQTRDQVIDFIEEIDRRVPGRLELFHLNDSKKEFGSKVDRHADLENGFIWGENTEGLKTLLEVSDINRIPMILETTHPIEDVMRINRMFYSSASSSSSAR